VRIVDLQILVVSDGQEDSLPEISFPFSPDFSTE
jgi:hypothetical protein